MMPSAHSQRGFVQVIGAAPTKFASAELQEFLFVLVEQSGVIAQVSIPYGRETASAAVLGIAGRIR